MRNPLVKLHQASSQRIYLVVPFSKSLHDSEVGCVDGKCLVGCNPISRPIFARQCTRISASGNEEIAA